MILHLYVAEENYGERDRGQRTAEDISTENDRRHNTVFRI